jgi:large subunit ribosomal protein L3
MKFILGTKGRMTTIFSDEGRAYAATIIEARPAMVTQVKTKEKDGYVAAQIGTNEVKESKVSKAQLGHAKGKAFKHFKEFRPRSGELAIEAGVTLDVSVFAPGDKVEVSALSKGKGFQGVVKRHGFAGGSRTHGQKHSEREPGAIGGGGRAGGRVPKGMRMAGRMGGQRVTVRNLTVLAVHPETNELVLTGAVPGRRGSLVEIRGEQ